MRIRRYLPLLLVSATVAAIAVPASAQTHRPYNPTPNTVRLRVGVFEPWGDSDYWDQRQIDFDESNNDYRDTSYGIDYVWMWTERFGLLTSLSGYEGSNTAAFRDFVDDFGNDIVHDTTLETGHLDFGAVYHFMRRDAAVSPYVGGGIGFYWYDLEESGEFIDFDRDGEIFEGTFTAEGDAFGGFLLAGLEVPIGENFGIFGQARFDWAADQLGDDFRDFGDIGLGGTELAGGLSFRF